MLASSRRGKDAITIVDWHAVEALQALARHLLEDDIDVTMSSARLEALSERAGATVPTVQQVLSQMRRTRLVSFSAGGPVH